MVNQKRKFSILKTIYEKPSNIGSFSSVYKLYQSAKNINKTITLNDVKQFLTTQDSYTLHKASK